MKKSVLWTWLWVLLGSAVAIVALDFLAGGVEACGFSLSLLPFSFVFFGLSGISFLRWWRKWLVILALGFFGGSLAIFVCSWIEANLLGF